MAVLEQLMLNACYGQALLILVMVHWNHLGISYTSECGILLL